MSQHITKHPELIKKENQIFALQKQLKKRNTTLKSLKTRLKNMQGEIEAISRKVQSQMMRQMEEIDMLRQEIAALAKKLAKVKGIGKEDKQALKMMAEELTEEEMFGEGFQQYKEHKEKMETGDFNFDENERVRIRNMFESFQVKPPEEEQRNIRKIYLKLSQKFHPDLAKNKQQEAKYHQMMQEINEAYQRNDIHALLELERLHLMEELDLKGGSFSIDVLDKEIKRLEREIDFINNQIDRTSGEIKHIRQSQFGEMLTVVNKAEKEGEGFEAMEAEHQQTIDMFTQLRDGLNDSIERGELSPILMEMMMGNTSPNMNDLDIEDVLAMMGGEMGEKFDPFSLFDEEEESFEEMENPVFPIGATVEVKINKSNPFYTRVKMKGWRGRVVSAYLDPYDNNKPTYLVEFDSTSMEMMPKQLIQNALEEMGDFQGHAFLEHQLKLSEERDTLEQAMGTYRRLFHENNWDYLSNEEQTELQAILLKEPALTDSENWDIHFENYFPTPWQAKTKGLFSHQGIPANHKCKVLSFTAYDPEMGHLLKIEPKGLGRSVQHPLVDLKPAKRDKGLVKLLSLYNEWADEMLDVY